MGPCGELLDFSITTAFRLKVSMRRAGLNSSGGRFIMPRLHMHTRKMINKF